MITKFWAAVAAAVAVLVLVVLALLTVPASGVEEDDPRWNCHTMGNQLCGPGA